MNLLVTKDQIGDSIAINIDRLDGIVINDGKPRIYVGGSEFPYYTDNTFDEIINLINKYTSEKENKC